VRRDGRFARAVVCVVPVLLLILVGCAKYNTYYNAKKAFDEAERVREEQIKKGEDANKASGNQKTNYENAYKKAQKLLDEYPGSDLTDDALFLQGKASQRLNNYRNSILKLGQLFTNFPQTPYMEEALYLQGVNYLMVGEAQRSRDTLDLLEKQFPKSRFQAQALRASGDNAYALEAWSEARDAYTAYLVEHPDVEDADEIGLRLATAEWKLRDYAAAAEVLRGVVDHARTAERSFNARLLLARCLTRLGDTAGTDALLGHLREDAEIYSKQGNVAIADAENLLAKGDQDGAAALLENMPAEWGARDVKAVASDMLAGIYLRRGELDEARKKYTEAVPGGDLLEDVDESKRLLKTIQDYLAAENALPDAAPDKAARLRLLQANALLFGFERPRAALDLYAAVAADSAADSTVAPRALYGAMVVCDRLDLPDSSQLYAEQLKARYPDSPQAYQVEAGASADLLAFLLAKQELAYASAGSRGSLDDAGLGSSAMSSQGRGTGLRRRMVYLQRRPNLVFPPPASALNARLALPAATSSVLPAAVVDSAAVRPAASDSATVGLAPADTAAAVSTPADTMAVRPAPADTAIARPAVAPPQTAPADTTTQTDKKKKKKGSQMW
jgi:outer membrane protein assembly factor BamD (BamD/ComL family)